MALPLSFLQWTNQLLDDNGDPLAGASIQFYEAGTTTPKLTYADVDGNTPSTTNGLGRVTFDSAGRPTDGSIFLKSGGYDALVYNATPTFVYSRSDFEDIGLTFLSLIGWQFAQGARSVTAGYVPVATDYFVTRASGDINLPPAVDRSDTSGNAPPLTLKNMGATTMAVVPNGTETIDGVTGSYSVPAAVSPNFPTITLYPVTSGWLIASSHGL